MARHLGKTNKADGFMTNRHSRRTTTARITALGLATTALFGSPTGTADAASTCQMGVEQPIYNGSIVASASWSRCYTGSHFTIRLREDRRFWPDRNIRVAKGSGVSGTKTLTYPCGTDFDPIRVFVEIRHGGRSVQSPRSVLPCA